MNKAVMLSIRPEWVERILNGEKTLEVRKSRPKLAYSSPYCEWLSDFCPNCGADMRGEKE